MEREQKIMAQKATNPNQIFLWTSLYNLYNMSRHDAETQHAEQPPQSILPATQERESAIPREVNVAKSGHIH